MTENETKAIKWMKNVRDDAVVTLDHIAKKEPNVSPMLYAGRKEKAETIINGFEELEQYRAIGTIDRFKQLSEQFAPHIIDNTSCPERYCNKCDKYRKENEMYHQIGTVEECREAVGKQKSKIPDSWGDGCSEGKIVYDMYDCPCCGRRIRR